MSTGILLLTHGEIAAALRAEAMRILPDIKDVAILGCAPDERCEQTHERLCEAIERLDHGQGVLILTDVCGATPCNQVTELINHVDYRERIRLVTGVNLPMLLKVLNYRDAELTQLAQLAVVGGTAGITQAAPA